MIVLKFTVVLLSALSVTKLDFSQCGPENVTCAKILATATVKAVITNN